MGDEHSNPDGRRTDSGQFAEKYAAEEFLDAIRVRGGSASTTDVAAEVGCPHRTAYHRLTNLRDADRVRSRKVGNSLLWEVDNDE